MDGYNPRGYNLFYTGENCQSTLVKEYKDTWWGKVIDFFGGELLVNNSWSGSRVTKLPGSENLFPAGKSIDDFNWTIRNVAAANNCKVIDFDRYCWAYNSVDGSHPMSDGMDPLAMMVIREMGNESVHRI